MTGIRVFITGITGFLISGGAFGQIISVSQLACNPNSLNSGSSTTCTVTLNGAAPASGTEVLLSSNNTLLQLAANSVIVPAGTTSTTFTATAGSVSTNQNGTLTATVLHSVLLNWSASISPNLMNYKVYRGTTSGGPYGVMTTLGIVTSYMDSNVQNSQTYYYVTTVVDGTGAESGYSNEASAVVPGLVSQSATVSLAAPVTAPVTLSSLVCSPTSVNSGSATTCTVSLNQAAPNGGTVVGLASNNNLLPVPTSSVTVPANATSTTFTATAGNMAANQSATLTASLNRASQTATISLLPSQPLMLSSLTCNPTSLYAAATTTCTVALSGAAPNGGMIVSLATNSDLLPVPAPLVIVPAKTTSATFTATAGNMAANQSATLTASLSGASQTATISLVTSQQPVMVSSLVCNPTSLSSRAVASCIVTLSKDAPTGGMVVALASNNNLLRAPNSSVTVRANRNAATFKVTAGLIHQSQDATLTATIGNASRQFDIGLVAGIVPSSLTCSPSVIRPGASTDCTVNLSEAAPPGSDINVALASNNGLLTVPSSIPVAAGASSATFSATAGHITRFSQPVKITASSGAGSTSVFVTIQRVRAR